uniref:B-cell receptor CD22 n=1 Tax=Gadus morhua TaxID=8049 RepID=A0A8C5CPX9_GADMO
MLELLFNVIVDTACHFLSSLLSPAYLSSPFTYSTSNVCGLRGSTADISCTFDYPDDVQYRPTTVTTLWFSKGDKYQPVDLEHDTNYRGRVVYSCERIRCWSRCHGACTLRIRDLRHSDSAVYKFRFAINQPTPVPQVKLSVTGKLGLPMCVWVYGPQHTSVYSSPSGEIEEGSSVTLSCSSDANPAAEYTWFKNNQPLLWEPSQPHTFPSVHPEDRGTYRCHAENKYGHLSSNSIFMDVHYAPNSPTVTVSPSGELEEGSSVTLSCSSDANPAANYTWFKEHDISVKLSGQNYTFTFIILDLGGNYYCQAHNAIGQHNSTFLFIKGVHLKDILPLCFSFQIPSLLWLLLHLSVLFSRRKRASSKACGQGGRPDTVEEVRHRKPFITNPSFTKTHRGTYLRPQHKTTQETSSYLFVSVILCCSRPDVRRDCTS